VTEALRYVARAARATERAAGRTTQARAALREAILAAHAKGESQRAIGKAAGLSHVQVHRIVTAAKNT
jgi:hypothetical protein